MSKVKNPKRFMTLEDAVKIVYELADQNKLDPESAYIKMDSILLKEAKRQQLALDMFYECYIKKCEGA